MSETLTELHLSARSILRVGDLFRVDSSRARYRVTAIRRNGYGGIEITGYGGKPGGNISSRSFHPGQVTRCQSTKEDPTAGARNAIHEVAEQSKKRAGRRA